MLLYNTPHGVFCTVNQTRIQRHRPSTQLCRTKFRDPAVNSLPSFNPYCTETTLHYTTTHTYTRHGANTLQPDQPPTLIILYERSLPARLDVPSTSTGAGASTIPEYEPQFHCHCHCHCQHAHEPECRCQPVAVPDPASITVPVSNSYPNTTRRRVGNTKRRTNGYSAVLTRL